MKKTISLVLFVILNLLFTNITMLYAENFEPITKLTYNNIGTYTYDFYLDPNLYQTFIFTIDNVSLNGKDTLNQIELKKSGKNIIISNPPGLTTNTKITMQILFTKKNNNIKTQYVINKNIYLSSPTLSSISIKSDKINGGYIVTVENGKIEDSP